MGSLECVHHDEFDVFSGDCTGYGQSQPELCDEQDNDCDGMTDEDGVCDGDPCGEQDVSWDACSGHLLAGGNGVTQQVSNQAQGQSGSATFQCANGTWQFVSGDCAADCPSQSVSWDQ